MKKRRWAWGLGIAGFALVSVGLLFYFGFGAVDIAPASRDLPQAVEAYRATGFPWEAKDLAPSPPLLDKDNAAPILHEAIQSFDQTAFDKLQVPGNPKIPSLGQLALAADYKTLAKKIEPFGPTLALLAKAAAKKGVDFHRDWDMGALLVFPEYASMKSFVKLLCYMAEAEAGFGHADEAATDLGRALKIAKFCGSEPILISELVQVSGEAIVCRSAVYCAVSLANNPSALQTLETSLANSWSPPSFTSALRGEPYMAIAILRNFELYGGLRAVREISSADPDAQPIHINPAELQRTGLPSGMLTRAFLDGHLRYWTGIAQECIADKGDPIKLSKDLDREERKLTEHHTISNWLEDIFAPVFSQAGMVTVREEADHLTTEALIEALAVKAKTGHLPQNISEIPGTWIDPFAHQPLRVKTTGDSIRIYSVGPAMKDLGGQTQNETKTQDFNVAAIYPPLKQRF